MPKFLALFGVKTIGAMSAIGTTTVTSLKVILFSEDSIFLWGKVKVFFF